MSLLLAAVGLAMALEGLVYALAPNAMKEFGNWLIAADPDMLRRGGLLVAALGACIIYATARFLN